MIAGSEILYMNLQSLLAFSLCKRAGHVGYGFKYGIVLRGCVTCNVSLGDEVTVVLPVVAILVRRYVFFFFSV